MTSPSTRPSPLGFEVPEGEPRNKIVESLLHEARQRYSVPTEDLTVSGIAQVAAERISGLTQVLQEQANRLNSKPDEDSRVQIMRTAIRWGCIAAMFITFLVVMNLNK